MGKNTWKKREIYIYIYIYKLIDRNEKEFFDINLHLLRYLSSQKVINHGG